MAYLESDLAAGYPKIWLELQALGWNQPDIAERVGRGGRPVARRAHRGFRRDDRRVRARPRAVPARGDGQPGDDVQRGDHGRAPVRHLRRSQRPASRWSSAGSSPSRRRSDDGHHRGADGPTAARAVARPLSGRGGVRRARRRQNLLRGVRRRRADRSLPQPLVDRPLALLEGADPLLRPPRPRGDLRRARKRQVGSADGSARVRRARVCRRHSGRHGGHGHGVGRARLALAERRPGAAPVGRACGARRGRGVHRPQGRAHINRPAESSLLRGRARHRRGVGQVEPPLLAPGLPRLRRVLHVADVHRAPLDEAVRGLRRLGARDLRRDADRDRAEPRVGQRGTTCWPRAQRCAARCS